MSKIIYIKEVAFGHLFFLLSLFIVGFSYGQSGCNASFTYDVSHCPNIHFYDNSTADSTIVCWMYDYNGEGNVDWCVNADNKYSNNGSFIVCLGIMTADGCTDTFCDTITIDCVCDKPEVSFSVATDTMTCQFNDLSISNYSDTQWFWDFGDGNTDTVQHPAHVYSAPGTYMACLTVQDSCDTKTVCQNIIIEDLATNVSSYSQDDKSLRIYPNPATGLSVFIDGVQESGQVSVVDMLGNLVASNQNYTSKSELDISEFAPGVYLVQFSSKHVSESLILIKK